MQSLKRSISPAATVWQLGFMGGVIENEYSIHCLCYMPYQTWPKGKLWVKRPNTDDLTKEINWVGVSYLNIKYLRHIWISLSWILTLLRGSNNIGDFTCGVTYNPLFYNRMTVFILKLLGLKRWVSIVADDLSKGNPEQTLFLSYDYYLRSNVLNKYFLDGGVSCVADSLPKKNCDTFVFLYAGAKTSLAGITDFVKLFNKLPRHFNIELHIYGKGDNIELDELSMVDDRIVLKGFVNDEELDIACRDANAFVNPRSRTTKYADNTFPSKLLKYIPYRKPIISTKAGGISPKYNSILEYYDPNNFAEFQRLVERLVSGEFSEYALLSDEFIRNNTWQKLTAGFLENLNK